MVEAFTPFTLIYIIKDDLRVISPPSLDSDLPSLYSLLDFHLDTYVELSMDSIRSTLLHMSHLSTCSLLSMVFKHFWNFFDLKDSTNGSIQFHQLSSHVVTSHIP